MDNAFRWLGLTQFTWNGETYNWSTPRMEYTYREGRTGSARLHAFGEIFAGGVETFSTELEDGTTIDSPSLVFSQTANLLWNRRIQAASDFLDSQLSGARIGAIGEGEALTIN